MTELGHQRAYQNSMILTTRMLLIVLSFFGLTGGLLAQVVSVTPSISSFTVHPGQGAVSVPVTVTLADGSSPATVTATNLPDGITVTPVTVTSSGLAQLTLYIGNHAGSGLFPNIGDEINVSQVSVHAGILATADSTPVTADLTIQISISDSGYLPASTDLNLPVVRINTSGVAIINDGKNVPGTVTITSANGATSFLPGSAGSDTTATFHVHGNSTAEMPKLPYTIKLNTPSDLLTSMGVSCPYVSGSGAAVCDKSKAFVLLANFVDKSMLRTWAAMELARAIPNGGGYLSSPSGSPSPSGTSTIMPWSSHSLYVDVYVNGEYEGVYQLIEPVKIDSHRVNMKSMAQTDINGNALTGGYLMEFNFRADGTTNFAVPHATWGITVDDPDFGQIIPEQQNYISSYVGTADTALFSSNYTNATQGWRDYFDTASLVNFYIVEDLTENWDSGRLAASAFLYKDRNNSLLYMGPAWDFDLSAGLSYDPSVLNPLTPWVQVQSPWFQRFFSDPAFKAAVATQWNTLKKNGVLDTWLASVSQKALTLQSAIDRNNKRWPMFGVPFWASSTAFDTYTQETGYLVGWYKARTAYLDGMFNPDRSASFVSVSVAPGSLASDVPTTLTATVTPAAATGDVVFLQNNGIVLGYSTPSDGVATFSGLLAEGSATVYAIYVGDGTYLPSTSSGIQVIVASAKKATSTLLVAPAGTKKLQPGTINAFAVSVVGNTGSASATGTVSLLFNGTVMQSGALAQGTANLAVPMLASGTYSVVARYSGDGIYASSDSPALAISISRPATHFDVTSSATQVSGIPFSFSITARDEQGDVPGDYSGTVHITATDTASTLPMDAALTNGVGTFTATLRTAGQASLTATDTANASLSGTSESFTVVAGPTTHFRVVAPALVQAGQSFSTLVVTALDSSDNVATSYSGTIRLSSSIQDASLPAPTPLVNGTRSFTATLITAGPSNILVTDSTTASLRGISNTITVAPGVATHLRVVAPTHATAGISITSITVEARDAYDNLATSYNGIVRFASFDGRATLPPRSLLIHGTASVSATFNTAGFYSILVADVALPSLHGSSDIIIVKPDAATHLSISSPLSVRAGTKTNFVVVTALDAHENIATSYKGFVHFTSTDSKAYLPHDAALSGGIQIFPFTLISVGRETLSVSGLSPELPVTSIKIAVLQSN